MIKNSYRTWCLLILTFVGTTVCAQGEQEAVKTVVNRLFEGMKRSDTALIRSVFSVTPILQTITKNREGLAYVASEPLDSFLVAVGRPHQEVYDERISFDLIRVDADLAMVWTPYKFYIGNRFSHCGVNSFQLVRINGAWKIQYLIDTRRRQDCE